MRPSIFQIVLGESSKRLPTVLQKHFFLSPDEDSRVFEGEMHGIWHKPKWIKPLLWLLSKGNTLFPETGNSIKVRLENKSYIDQEGFTCMSWKRSFFFPHRTRYFHATMKYDHNRNVILDYFGRNGELEAELFVDFLVANFKESDIPGLIITSGLHRYRIGQRFIKISDWLTPKAVIREWSEDGSDDVFGINVEISHPWIGSFFGYNGRFLLSTVKGMKQQ